MGEPSYARLVDLNVLFTSALCLSSISNDTVKFFSGLNFILIRVLGSLLVQYWEILNDWHEAHIIISLHYRVSQFVHLILEAFATVSYLLSHSVNCAVMVGNFAKLKKRGGHWKKFSSLKVYQQYWWWFNKSNSHELRGPQPSLLWKGALRVTVTEQSVESLRDEHPEVRKRLGSFESASAFSWSGWKPC